jgi:hypothetical protein
MCKKKKNSVGSLPLTVPVFSPCTPVKSVFFIFGEPSDQTWYVLDTLQTGGEDNTAFVNLL